MKTLKRWNQDSNLKSLVTIIHTLLLVLLFTISKANIVKENQELAFNTFSIKTSYSENRVNQIVEGHYLIVGSFSLLKNAKTFVEILRNESLNAEFAYYKETSKYYVFLYNSKDLSLVRKNREKIRQEEMFKEAWILSVRGGNILSNEEAFENKPLKTDNAPTKPNSIDNSISENIMAVGDNASREVKIYMNVFDGKNFKEIPAAVKAVYGEKNQLIGLLDAHKTQVIRVPLKEVPEIQLECEAFGYKKVEHDLNILNSATKNDTIVVDFELVRYKMGDVFTMFNVFFYNDATIMLPKSSYELNSLVDMVRENPNLKIMVHGHTNGNSNGKIIMMNKENKDFFNLSPSNKRIDGSAKELSYERALTIKNYLLEQGISEDRIEVKGWGGRKMIYPIESPDAKKNVRVEIEILRD